MNVWKDNCPYLVQASKLESDIRYEFVWNQIQCYGESYWNFIGELKSEEE